MKPALLITIVACLACQTGHTQERGTLENAVVAWRWEFSAGKLTSSFNPKNGAPPLALTGECFQLELGNGQKLRASDFKLTRPARMQDLPIEPDSPTVSRHFGGKQLILEFTNAEHQLAARVRVVLREGSAYVRQSLTLSTLGQDVLLKEIILLDQQIPGAERRGVVVGSPVVAGEYFFGCEHPMSQNLVETNSRVQCRLTRNAVLKSGEELTENLVVGVAPSGQMRRAFLAYIERERAHPYRPFLHYNSWYDIAWDKQKFNEVQSLNVIQQFGSHLVVERGVQMDSFLFDDGWDDNQTLWRFHSGFPNGFTRLKAAVAAYHSGIGVWISPFGGYDEARRLRLEYGSKLGYETNASGFSLAGAKYYQLFRNICREMIQKYGVNQFKFDGLAAGTKAGQNGLTRDGDAMLQLVADLRADDPGIYINQTTGTWPSPFWLLAVDSTWRGGDDHNFQGPGSWCQQWLTYRDAQTFNQVVKTAPLYPLNALMLHGVIYATNAAHLAAMTDEDFAIQVREFFGGGTQLQELYITPGLLNRQNWDDLAEAANWSRRNADVLVDTHWVGGDPGKGNIYGWASWSPRKGILTLRNPSSQEAAFTAELKTLFELPPGAPEAFQLLSPWKQGSDWTAMEISPKQSHTYHLHPFEVLTLEALPVSVSDRKGSGGASKTAPVKTSALSGEQ